MVALAAGLALAGSVAADAATVSGGGSFSANAGSSRFVPSGSAGGASPFNCGASGMDLEVNDGTYAPLPANIGSAKLTFSSCTRPLGISMTFDCTSTPQSALVLSGSPVGGVSTGSITGIRCVMTVTLTGCPVVFEGSLPVQYANPGVVNVNGRLTVQVPGQSLGVTSTGCSSMFPIGPYAFGAPVGSGTGLANLSYNLTSVGPTIL